MKKTTDYEVLIACSVLGGLVLLTPLFAVVYAIFFM